MKRHIRLIAIITAVIAIAFLVGNIALFNMLPKPMRMEKPVKIDYGISDPQFLRTMGSILHHPITEGNQIDLLRDGEAIYAAMLEAVDGAKHSITFETYEFWGKKSAGKFADALADAARRGVEVHALLDFVGSVRADKDKFKRMEEAGVEVIRWRRPSWYQLSRFNHRTHRKLLVVDGRKAFIGGANIADNWLPDENNNAYRDNHFFVQGPVVANMQAAFMETWLDARGKKLGGDRYFPELTAKGDLRAQVVKSSPREGRHRMRVMFLYAIAAAQEQITAGTAYFFPDKGFLDALKEAADRGVKVRILMPGESINHGFLRHASINRWQPILEAGVEIYEYETDMYHSKLMSIDNQWASIGSVNLDNRSFRINDEANLNVYDEDFARFIRELIEEDMVKARRYDLERWKQCPWYHRLYGQIVMIIGPHL